MPDEAPIRAVQTSPHDWKYLAEGGSTIVFSYIGPPNATFDGTVLRLRKIAHRESHDPGTTDEPDDPTILFQRTVVQRLVPAQYLPRLQSVELDGDWVRQLDGLWEELRPVDRRRKSRLDISRRNAVLAPNLAAGDGVVVEIKPKWGFLPNPAYLSAATRPIKTRTCRFCMHAHLKHTRGAPTSPGYCPLDLYSGDEARVVQALQALWDAWIANAGLGNNLRIFIDGEMLRPSSESGSLDHLFRRLPRSQPASNPVSTSRDDVRHRFVRAVLPTVLSSPVLDTLAGLQRSLDPLDIEGLFALWTNVHMRSTSAPPVGSETSDPALDEWTAFVDEYPFQKAGQEGSEDELALSVENLRYHCLGLLLSGTFKDCSLVIRLPTGASCSPQGTITLIDLDVKNIARLAKWERLDREIVGAYAETGSARICLERRTLCG